MFFNYFKISVRLMMRNALYSSISIFGLTIGLVSFYILWLYATTQLRTDQYHLNANRIARIGFNWEWTDNGVTNSADAGGLKSSLAVSIKNDFPEVEDYVRVLLQQDFNQEMVRHNRRLSLAAVGYGDDRIFKEEKVVYADANLFEFFSIPLLFGNAANVLREPGGVVLSATTAKKYFSEPDPRGELLKLNDSVTLKVTGVFEDLPDNTHLDFDLVIPNSTHLDQWNTSFFNTVTTYVRLKDESFEAFEARLNTYTQQYWGEVLKAFDPVRITMFVQPLGEIAFSQSYVGDYFPPKSRSFFYTLGFISLSVLFMAWINHINLCISRTVKRFKEIAARKVSGASQRDMIRQFMVESAIIYCIAALLALTVIQLVRGSFQSFFNITILDLDAISTPDKFLFVLIILLGVITSGLYPVYSSRYLNPASLFKLSKPSKEKRKFTSIEVIN